MEERQENNEKRDARERRPAIDIDMNPMVDLAFLLLTFFMLTTTFNKPQAMELIMPVKPEATAEHKEQPVKESRTLTLIPFVDGKVLWFQGITDPEVGSVDIASGELRSLLMRLDTEVDKMVVLIKPHDRSKYKTLIDLLDDVNITKLKRYALVELTEMDHEILKSEGYE